MWVRTYRLLDVGCMHVRHSRREGRRALNEGDHFVNRVKWKGWWDGMRGLCWGIQSESWWQRTSPHVRTNAGPDRAIRFVLREFRGFIDSFVPSNVVYLCSTVRLSTRLSLSVALCSPLSCTHRLSPSLSLLLPPFYHFYESNMLSLSP